MMASNLSESTNPAFHAENSTIFSSDTSSSYNSQPKISLEFVNRGDPTMLCTDGYFAVVKHFAGDAAVFFEGNGDI